MSSSIPLPACRIAHHLVSVPFSSRIGYRMISKRNPSHAIPDTTTSASYPPSPRLISSPYLLPAPLPAEPCRPTGRLKARRHPVRYSPRLPVSPACHHLPAPSHRLIRSARCLLALPAARRRHPPPAPCCSSISSSPPHLIRFAPSHWLIALPYRMRRATSRRNGARNRQSAKRKRNTTTSDAYLTTQMPLHARRIAHTSRITHGHSHETHPQENAPYMPITTPLTGNTRRGDGTTTGHLSSLACLPIRRRDDDACLPPDTTTTERRTSRRTATRPTTRRHGTNDGTRETG